MSNGPTNFFLWVFLLSAAAADKIVAALVRKDYAVRPGFENGTMPPRANGDRPCVTLLLDVQPSKPKTAIDVERDVVSIMNAHQIKIFGYVLSPSHEGRCGSPTNSLPSPCLRSVSSMAVRGNFRYPSSPCTRNRRRSVPKPTSAAAAESASPARSPPPPPGSRTRISPTSTAGFPSSWATPSEPARARTSTRARSHARRRGSPS